MWTNVKRIESSDQNVLKFVFEHARLLSNQIYGE